MLTFQELTPIIVRHQGAHLAAGFRTPPRCVPGFLWADALRNTVHWVTRRGVGFADEVFKLGELTPILVRAIACVETHTHIHTHTHKHTHIRTQTHTHTHTHTHSLSLSLFLSLWQAPAKEGVSSRQRSFSSWRSSCCAPSSSPSRSPTSVVVYLDPKPDNPITRTPRVQGPEHQSRIQTSESIGLRPSPSYPPYLLSPFILFPLSSSLRPLTHTPNSKPRLLPSSRPPPP